MNQRDLPNDFQTALEGSKAPNIRRELEKFLVWRLSCGEDFLLEFHPTSKPLTHALESSSGVTIARESSFNS